MRKLTQKQRLGYWGVILVCLILLFDSKCASATQMSLEIRPVTQISTIGSMTNIDIWMNNQTGKLVAGIYLALNFDPDILVYKDYTFGKRPMLFVDCVDPGSFKIAALDFSGFNQNQPLISVQFMSLNTGISSLTSSIEIYNAFGKMLGTASDTESIDVREAAHPVPEPSAMLLLGGGLSSIGLLRMRRKNRQV